MTSANEEKIADEIVRWLDSPLKHLADETRRDGIELILIVHFDKLRRASERKVQMQSFAMYGGIIGLVLTLVLNSGRILELFGQ
jgi:hypothetical protein